VPQDGDPWISVIVVAFESGAHLGRCLQALEAQTRRDFEVILVDNASTDGAVDRLPEPTVPFRLIRNAQNLGFAAANNQAAAQARGAWLATLNPDAFPQPDWLERFGEAAGRYPGVAAFGSTQLLDRDPLLIDGAGDPYHALGVAWRGEHGRPDDSARGDGEVFGPCGAAAFYDRAAFLAAGGFEPSFFCYYEDVDLAFRLRLSGQRCVQLAAARVRHVGSGGSALAVYLNTRNILWTVLRCMPGPLLALLLPAVAAMSLARLGRSALRGDAGTRARALRDALAALPEVRQARRRIQRGRRIGSWAVARAMTWSVPKLVRRRADLRSVDRLRRYPAPPVAAGDTGVAAVIVTFHPDDLLRAAVAALDGQVDRIVIVDNGSAPDAVAGLRALAGPVTVIENGTNLGLGAAQNIGIAHAMEGGAGWVLLLDQDSVHDPGMVAAMPAAWQAHPRRAEIALVAPRLHDAAGTIRAAAVTSRGPWHVGRRPLAPGDRRDDVLFAIASGSLLRSAALRGVGLMRADYFIDYVDVELCLRLRRQGWRILAVGDAGLLHRYGTPVTARIAGRSVTVAAHDAQRRYLIYRNRVRTWRIHGGRFPAWIAFELAAIARDLVRLTLEPDRGAKLKALLRGLRDGVRA